MVLSTLWSFLISPIDAEVLLKCNIKQTDKTSLFFLIACYSHVGQLLTFQKINDYYVLFYLLGQI